MTTPSCFLGLFVPNFLFRAWPSSCFRVCSVPDRDCPRHPHAPRQGHGSDLVLEGVKPPYSQPEGLRSDGGLFHVLRTPGTALICLGTSLSERLKQVAYGKLREAKNRAPQIEVMPHTAFKSPLHPRKQMKGLADMSENDLSPENLHRAAAEKTAPTSLERTELRSRKIGCRLGPGRQAP